MLAFVAEAQAVDGPEPFPTGLLERLARLVPCDVAYFRERDHVHRLLLANAWASADGTYVGSHGTVEDDDGSDLLEMNPLFVYPRRTGDLSVMKLSDFASRRVRIANGPPTEVFCGDVVDVIGFPLLPSFTHTLNFGFKSARRDFTERDRVVLQLLRPHLEGAHRSAGVRRFLARALAALDADAAEDPPAVVLLGRARCVDFASRSARQLLDAFFGSDARLPDELESWLRTASGRQYTTARSNRRLVVDAHGADRSVLLLREEPNSDPLTQREWDVMRCVAGGMSNAEIGRVLWISDATVRKHLENIYGKLGVRSRTAALL